MVRRFSFPAMLLASVAFPVVSAHAMDTAGDAAVEAAAAEAGSPDAT